MPQRPSETSASHDITTSQAMPQSAQHDPISARQTPVTQVQTAAKVNLKQNQSLTISANNSDPLNGQSPTTNSISPTIPVQSPNSNPLTNINQKQPTSTNPTVSKQSTNSLESASGSQSKLVTSDATPFSPKRSSPDQPENASEKSNDASDGPQLKKARSAEGENNEIATTTVDVSATKGESIVSSSNAETSTDQSVKKAEAINSSDESGLPKKGTEQEGESSAPAETENVQASDLKNELKSVSTADPAATKKSQDVKSDEKPSNSIPSVSPSDQTVSANLPTTEEKAQAEKEVSEKAVGGKVLASLQPSEQTIAPMEIDKSDVESGETFGQDVIVDKKSSEAEKKENDKEDPDLNGTRKRALSTNAVSVGSDVSTVQPKKQKTEESTENMSSQAEKGLPSEEQNSENPGTLAKLRSSTVPAGKPGASTAVPPTFGLRSTPVHTGLSSIAKSLRSAASPSGTSETTLRSQPAPQMAKLSQTQEENDNVVKENAEAEKPTKKREKRKISWAPQEKLVETQFIDTRLALIRSWDPECDITLPFAPNTLQMLRGVIQEQDARESGKTENEKGDVSTQAGRVQMPIQPSFEEARKREHDMELERAQQAKMKIKEKLNSMLPKRRWKSLVEVVLPAECRMDDSKVEDYTMFNEPYQPAMPDNMNMESPVSPPPEYQRRMTNEDSIRFFPLSSDENDARENGGLYYPTGPHGGDGMHYTDVQAAANNAYMGNPGNPRHDLMTMGADQNQANMVGDRRQPNFMHPMGPGMPTQTVQQMLSALKSSGLFSSPGNGAAKNQPLVGNMIVKGGQGEENYDESGVNNVEGRGYGNEKNDPFNDGEGMEQQAGHDNSMIMPDVTAGMNPNIPPGMLGHPGFAPQSMDGSGMAFGMPPIPPGSLDMIQNMMHMGMRGVPMPLGMPMMPMPMGPNGVPGVPGMPPQGPGGNIAHQNNNRGRNNNKSSGRVVETITRPKSKPTKQRKCKYFGTKQGCRDGNACTYLH